MSNSYNNWAESSDRITGNVVTALWYVAAQCYVEILHTTLKLNLQVEEFYGTSSENPTAQWSQILWNET